MGTDKQAAVTRDCAVCRCGAWPLWRMRTNRWSLSISSGMHKQLGDIEDEAAMIAD